MSIIVDPVLQEVYDDFKLRMAEIDRQCLKVISDMEAGPVDADRVLNLHRYMKKRRAWLDTIVATSGIEAYAQTAESNPGYALLTEIASVQTAMTGVMTWISTNFPSSGGYLLYVQIVGEDILLRQLDTAASVGLRTALQAVCDSIG